MIFDIIGWLSITIVTGVVVTFLFEMRNAEPDLGNVEVDLQYQRVADDEA